MNIHSFDILLSVPHRSAFIRKYHSKKLRKINIFQFTKCKRYVKKETTRDSHLISTFYSYSIFQLLTMLKVVWHIFISTHSCVYLIIPISFPKMKQKRKKKKKNISMYLDFNVYVKIVILCDGINETQSNSTTGLWNFNKKDVIDE